MSATKSRETLTSQGRICKVVGVVALHGRAYGVEVDSYFLALDFMAWAHASVAWLCHQAAEALADGDAEFYRESELHANTLSLALERGDWVPAQCPTLRLRQQVQPWVIDGEEALRSYGLEFIRHSYGSPAITRPMFFLRADAKPLLMLEHTLAAWSRYAGSVEVLVSSSDDIARAVMAEGFSGVIRATKPV